MSKVYLAAQYPRRNEMKHVANLLRSNHIDVTSRWIEESLPLTTQLNDISFSQLLRFAEIDSEDIREADALVLFSEDPLVGLPRGTHHTEFGYAMGLGKRVIVIGGYENVFHYLPEVIHYSSLGDFLDAEGIQNADTSD
jgi:nucleoside 2-deoxyribosyltransferase